MTALRGARLPGRTQWLQPAGAGGAAGSPTTPVHLPVLLDGAHNPAGIEALCTHLLHTVQNGHGPRARVFFSVMRDKEYLSVYRALRAVTEDIVFLDMSSLFPRALAYEDLYAELSQAMEGSGEGPPLKFPLREASLAWDSIEPLLRSGSGADYAVFCGSLFLLGEVIPLLLPHYQGLEDFAELVGEREEI